MIRCAKCDNDTRTSALVTAQGDVLLAGTIGTDPQPISAQVCTACGYIELYAPQPVSKSEPVAANVATLPDAMPEASVPAAINA